MKSTAYRLAEFFDTRPSGLAVVSPRVRGREVPTVGRVLTTGSGVVAAVVSISRGGEPGAPIELMKHSIADPAPRDPGLPHARPVLRDWVHDGRLEGRCVIIGLEPDEEAVIREGYVGDAARSPEGQATAALVDLFGSVEGHDLLSPGAIDLELFRSVGSFLRGHVHPLVPLHMAMDGVHSEMYWPPLP